MLLILLIFCVDVTISLHAVFGLRGTDRDARRRRLRNVFFNDSDEGDWMPVNSSTSSESSLSDATTVEFDGMMDDEDDDDDDDNGGGAGGNAEGDAGDNDDDDDDVAEALGGGASAAAGSQGGAAANGPVMPEFLERALRGAAFMMRDRQNRRDRQSRPAAAEATAPTASASVDQAAGPSAAVEDDDVHWVTDSDDSAGDT